MRYTGMQCEACKRVFDDNDDVVCCPVCGAPHHRECWFSEGKCASEGLHAQGYVWKMPIPEATAPVVVAKEETNEGSVKFPDGSHSVTCPHCGAENFPDDIYCRACHEQIKKDVLFDFHEHDRHNEEDSGEYGSDQGENPDRQRQNMYNAYTVYGGLHPDAKIDNIPVREYAQYIGKNSGSYIRKFSIAWHFRKSTMWNWAAALFGPIWFFSRKQAKIGAVLSTVIILLSALAGVLSMTQETREYTEALVNSIQTYSAEYAQGKISYEDMLEKVNADVAEEAAHLNAQEPTARSIAAVAIEYFIISGSVIFSGLYGNRFYKAKVQREILDSREKCTNVESYNAMLMARGGTSVGLSCIGVILQLIASALLTYLPIVYVLLTQ